MSIEAELKELERRLAEFRALPPSLENVIAISFIHNEIRRLNHLLGMEKALKTIFGVE